MENHYNAVWTRFMHWLDQYSAALAYDPIGDLHAGIARLEEEVRALRHGDTPSGQSFTRLSQNISRERH
jgi:hypothetical protein